MDNFWKKLKTPFFVLAPMADVTDLAFRQIIVETGRPDVFYTEFVSVAGLCSEKGRPKLLPHLKFKENERPIVAQVFGSNPSQFYEVAKLVKELGFDGIDINMGCPDRKIMKQGAGISLCKRPELAVEIIKETKRGAGDMPVSVKTRLGFNEIDLTWIQKVIDAEPDALLVHLRTMKEMSKEPAHWELAKQVADMAHAKAIPIIGNGDVASYTDGLEKAKESGMDGIMVGRGIFHNPWFFNREVNHKDKTAKERIALLKKHIENFVELWGTDKNFDVMKRFIKIYINDFEGAKTFRDKLMGIKTSQELVDYLSTVEYTFQ